MVARWALGSDDRLPPESAASREAALAAAQGRPLKPPATCSYCGMTFRKLEHCQRHERTHTHDRPYPCSVCAKTFARQDTLNRHVRLHTRGNDVLSLLNGKKRPRLKSASFGTYPSPLAAAAGMNHQRRNSEGTHPVLSAAHSPHLASGQPKRVTRHRGYSLSAVDEHQPSNRGHRSPTRATCRSEAKTQGKASIASYPIAQDPTQVTNLMSQYPLTAPTRPAAVFGASTPPSTHSSYSDVSPALGWNPSSGMSPAEPSPAPTPFDRGLTDSYRGIMPGHHPHSRPSGFLAQSEHPICASLMGMPVNGTQGPPMLSGTAESFNVHDNAFGLLGLERPDQMHFNRPSTDGFEGTSFLQPDLEEDEGWSMFLNDLDNHPRNDCPAMVSNAKDEADIHNKARASWSSDFHSVALDNDHAFHLASPQDFMGSPSDVSSAFGARSDSISSFGSQGFESKPQLSSSTETSYHSPIERFHVDTGDLPRSFTSAYSTRPHTTGADSLASSLQTDISLWSTSPQSLHHSHKNTQSSRPTSADPSEAESLMKPNVDSSNVACGNLVMGPGHLGLSHVGMPNALSYLAFDANERPEKLRHRHRPPSISLSDNSPYLGDVSPLFDAVSASPALGCAYPSLQTGEAGFEEDWRRILDFQLDHATLMAAASQQGNHVFGQVLETLPPPPPHHSSSHPSLYNVALSSSLTVHGIHRNGAYAHGEPETAVEVLGSPSPDPFTVSLNRTSSKEPGRAGHMEYPLTPEGCTA